MILGQAAVDSIPHRTEDASQDSQSVSGQRVTVSPFYAFGIG